MKETWEYQVIHAMVLKGISSNTRHCTQGNIK